MKVVIDIPDRDYAVTLTKIMLTCYGCKVTELPKGHGDLIDREELLKAIDTWDKFGVDNTNSLFRLDNLSLPHYVPYIHYDDIVKSVSGAETIIEAESEEEK